MDDLRFTLLILGIVVIAGIYAWGRWRHRLERFYAREEAENAEAYAALDRLQDSRAADNVRGLREAGEESERLEPRIGTDLDERERLPPGFDIDALDEMSRATDATDSPMPVLRARPRSAGEAGDADPLLDPAPAAVDLPADPEVSRPDAHPGTRAAPTSPGGVDDAPPAVVAVRAEPEQLDLSGLEVSSGAGSEEPATAGRETDPDSRAADGRGAGLVIALTVMAPSGQRFDGASLREALEARGLEHGDMQAFHRRRPGGGPSVYVVANVLTPGTFDLDTMDALRTPGVALVLQLPGPRDPVVAFREMLETARHLADALGGRTCDDTRSTLTTQSVNHIEERIAEFGRQRLLNR